MTDRIYNGWTNYATWRINLELFDGFSAADFTDGTDDAYELGKSLQCYAEDTIEQTSSEGIARDYALAFIAEVNWTEIAQHIIDAHAEEMAE